jgi:hypothetical protein
MGRVGRRRDPRPRDDEPSSSDRYYSRSGILVSRDRGCVVLLLDHEVASVTLDYVLDVEKFMALNDREPEGVLTNRFVLGRAQLDELTAVGMGALADEADDRVAIARVAATFDVLVDAPRPSLCSCAGSSKCDDTRAS